ncbi:hypothetical protein HZS92_01482 [Xanthomonas citri pv. citri]|nr:hypothetical protein HZS91_01525 [Xanthomonas citri pv. citri]QYF39420.1 hypothetical protein HZS92_01482 [Xanthomonas citri pv. citri]QYF44194.1 hypothetical protein HZS93_01483 [Xanthomonas citri]CCF66649.1 putative uncharacterized protein [Xanthomonas citri pv. punicae str. LMG 859]
MHRVASNRLSATLGAMPRPADVCVVMGWRAFRHGHLLRKADSSWRDMQGMPLSINGLPHPGRKASTRSIDTAASGLALVRLSGLQPRLAARRVGMRTKHAPRHADAPCCGPLAAISREPPQPKQAR